MTSDDEVIWQRAHPGYILVEAVGFVKALIIPLVLLVVNRGFHFDLNSPDAIGTWFALAVMAGGLVIGAIQWKLFSFALTPTRLLVKSGVFSRRERSIPYERIQSVDLVQTPLLRMLRLSRVSIQTAVAGSNEDANVEIKAIGEDDAGVLRSRLMAAGRDEYPGDIGREADGVGAGPPQGGTVQTGQVVYGLPIGRLMLAGATSGTVAPAFALLAVVVNWANELVPDSVYSNNRLWSIGDGVPALSVVMAIVLIGAVLAWTIAILGTVLLYYGFRLIHDGDHLIAEYGLLDHKRITIPVQRIQALRIDEGILRQPLGFGSLLYESAGHTDGKDQEEGRGFLCPFLPMREIGPFLEHVLPVFSEQVNAGWKRPPRRAARRFWMMPTLGFTAIVVAIGLGIHHWWNWWTPWELLALALPVSVLILGWLEYRDSGWKAGNTLVIVRGRMVGRSTTLVLRRRLQFRGMSANPFQRRAGLADVELAYARGGSGSVLRVRHLDVDVARSAVESAFDNRLTALAGTNE